MKKNLHNKVGGFTLIELLVVIAIIGILSSVVLVSLNTARSKGKDARIQGEIAQIKTSLETEFTGSYYPSLTGATAGTGYDATTSPMATGGTGNANIVTLAKDIFSLSGVSAIIYATSTSGSGSTAQSGQYAIVTKNASGTFICYDSLGTASTSYTGGMNVTTASFTGKAADCTK